jgi:hypothetical protein
MCSPRAGAPSIRASRRAGELIAEGQKKGEIAVPGDYGRGRSAKTEQMSLTTTSKPKTLPELGITRDQSSQWKELAGISEEFESDQRPAGDGVRICVSRRTSWEKRCTEK